MPLACVTHSCCRRPTMPARRQPRRHRPTSSQLPQTRFEWTLLGRRHWRAWGTSVFASVDALEHSPSYQLDVVQLMGGVGQHTVDSPDIGGCWRPNWADATTTCTRPCWWNMQGHARSFLNEPAVREGLLRAAQVRLAIVGIGAVHDKASSFLRAGLLTRSDLAHLRTEEPWAKCWAASTRSMVVWMALRLISGLLGVSRRVAPCAPVDDGRARSAQSRSHIRRVARPFCQGVGHRRHYRRTAFSIT